MPMTKAMRAALEAAKRQDGLRRTHDDKPGKPPWPANPNTLHALVRCGYLEVTEGLRNSKGWLQTVWKITEAGRLALDPQPKIGRDTVKQMGGRTVTLIRVGDSWESRSVPEPEKVTLPKNSPSAMKAQQRWQRDQLQMQKAREALSLGEIVAREIAAARQAGVDTEVYEESILRRLRALRKRTERRAA